MMVGCCLAIPAVQSKTGKEMKMECKQESNLNRCSCTYTPCKRKGICCDCVAYHLKSRELPGCFFSKEAERTYDRSFEIFADLVKTGKI